MKPSIDEQIEAVEYVIANDSGRDHYSEFSKKQHADLCAALETLRWVKLKTKPALGSVMEAFPGAKVVSQEDE
jgi:hypothetical protein